MNNFLLEEAFKVVIYAAVCQGSSWSPVSGCRAVIPLLMRPVGMVVCLVRAGWSPLRRPEKDFSCDVRHCPPQWGCGAQLVGGSAAKPPLV